MITYASTCGYMCKDIKHVSMKSSKYLNIGAGNHQNIQAREHEGT